MLEPFFLEEGAERSDFCHIAVILELFLQIAALQANQAIRQSVLPLLLEILLDDFHQVRQLHHSTAYHEIILSFLILTTQVLSHKIFQADGRSHLIAHANLLAGSIDELELAFWEENGKRNTRETATTSEVKNLCTRTEIDALAIAME